MKSFLTTTALTLGIIAMAPAAAVQAADMSWAFSRLENGEALFNITNNSANKKVYALAWHGTFFVNGKKYVFERSANDKLRLNRPIMPGETHVIRLDFDAPGKPENVFMDRLWWDYEELTTFRPQ